MPAIIFDKDGYDELGYDKDGKHNGDTDEDRKFKKFALDDHMEESGSGDKFYASILATNEDERRTLVAKMLTYVRHHLKQPERAYVRKVVELAKSRFDTASHYEKPADFLKEGLLKDVVANPYYN